jgi:hypothetical protein
MKSLSSLQVALDQVKNELVETLEQRLRAEDYDRYESLYHIMKKFVDMKKEMLKILNQAEKVQKSAFIFFED